MAERAWSIAPTFAPAATFERFQGTPGENGRRWLRRFLFHYHNATPAQLVSLIDIHLIGEAAEWADANEDIRELLSAEDSATDRTIKRFQDLFNERFGIHSIAGSQTAIVLHREQAVALPVYPGKRSTTQSVVLQSPPSQATILQEDLNGPTESVSSGISQALAHRDDNSLKRARSIEDGAVEQASKKRGRQRARVAPTSNEAETTKTPFFTPPFFKWEHFRQFPHETVEQYGLRALDLFTATGGVDRTRKKQHFFPGQLVYLRRVVTFFVSGLRDTNLRRKILFTVIKKMKSNKISLERVCATAHEYAQLQAQGIEISDNEIEDESVKNASRSEGHIRRLNAWKAREMEASKKRMDVGEEQRSQNKEIEKAKDIRASRNLEASPFAQYKLSDQAASSFRSDAVGQYMMRNGSTRFKPADMRLRGVHALESIKSDE